MNEDMKAALEQLFKDVITTPIDPDKARVFVLMNGMRFKETNDTPTAKPVTETKTLFFEVINPHHHLKNEIGDFEVIGSGALNNNEAESKNPFQTEYLIKVLQRIKPETDEKVFLITWDHGSAFGIFREQEPEIAQVVTSITHNLDAHPYLKQFWEKAEKESPDIREITENSRKNTKQFLQIRDRIYTVAAPQRLDTWSHDVQSRLRVKHIPPFTEHAPEQLIIAPMNFSAANGEGIVLDKSVEAVADAREKNMTVVVEDVTVREILSNKELATALHTWLRKKLDVLLMMNCWMMNLHSMYAFRNDVHYFVAPQSDIGTPGYNYRDILRAVYEGRAATGEALARICVETSENRRIRRLARNMRPDFPDIVDSWKIFAMNLQVRDEDGVFLLMKQVQSLKALIDVMVEVQNSPLEPGADKLLTELKWLYKYARSVCFDFTTQQCMMVDIFNWALSLVYVDRSFEDSDRKIVDGRVRDAIGEFRDLCDRLPDKPSLKLCSTKGAKVYTLKDGRFKPTAVIRLPPFGYSLFFPLFPLDTEKTPFAGVIDNAKNDGLLNDHLSNWQQFLRDCIDKDICY